MKHALIPLVVLAVLAADAAAVTAPTKPLTLQEILFLKKMGNSEATILGLVRDSATVLKLSDAEKQKLRTAGFTEAYQR